MGWNASTTSTTKPASNTRQALPYWDTKVVIGR
jgi:hypothetical protein